MVEWSEAQVSEWILLIDLPDGCPEAVQDLFSDMDGEELLELTPKTLQRMLRKDGVEEPVLVAQTILRQRDAAARQDAGVATTTDGTAAGGGEAPECPFCMHPYTEAGLHVPRILPCGHTGCQDCYARMLRPIVAENNAKPLTCPDCRVVTPVARGRADSLTKNFGMLR